MEKPTKFTTLVAAGDKRTLPLPEKRATILAYHPVIEDMRAFLDACEKAKRGDGWVALRPMTGAPYYGPDPEKMARARARAKERNAAVESQPARPVTIRQSVFGPVKQSATDPISDYIEKWPPDLAAAWIEGTEPVLWHAALVALGRSGQLAAVVAGRAHTPEPDESMDVLAAFEAVHACGRRLSDLEALKRLLVAGPPVTALARARWKDTAAAFRSFAEAMRREMTPRINQLRGAVPAAFAPLSGELARQADTIEAFLGHYVEACERSARHAEEWIDRLCEQTAVSSQNGLPAYGPVAAGAVRHDLSAELEQMGMAKDIDRARTVTAILRAFIAEMESPTPESLARQYRRKR